MKPVFWLGSSREDLRDFPRGARREIGYQLEHVQEGVGPNDWKPMSTVGPGCERFASGNRREFSAAFIWRHGRRESMTCTASKRRPGRQASRIWTWQRSDLSRYGRNYESQERGAQ